MSTQPQTYVPPDGTPTPSIPQIPDAATPRDVAVGYTCRRGGGCYVGQRVMPGADVLTATATILEDLAIAPEALIVRPILCDGARPALLLAACRTASHPQVVAIVRDGLTEYDLNLALLRLTPAMAVELLP